MRTLKTRFAWLVMGSAAAHAVLLTGAGLWRPGAQARVWPVDIAIVVEVRSRDGTAAPVAVPDPPRVAQPEPAPVPEPTAETAPATGIPRLQPRSVQPPEPPALAAIPVPQLPAVESTPALGAPAPPAPELRVARTVSATLVFDPTPEPSAARPVADAPPAAGSAASAVAPSLLPGNPTPLYPLAARRANVQGTVVLKVGISSEGRVVDVKVEASSGHVVLDQEAVRTARRWRFSPAQENGRRTGSELSIPVRFVLTDY
jgi:protein TonB